MATHDTIRRGGGKRLTHTALSALVTLLAVALLVYRVMVEGEPGAVPLLLLAAGVGWFVWARIATRPRAGHGPAA